MRKNQPFTGFAIVLLMSFFAFCGKKYDVESEEKIALDNINFGISREQYSEEIKVFMENRMDSTDSSRYSLDGYMFEYVAPKFHDDQLYELNVEGRPFGSYQTAYSQYLEIKSLLVDKYGSPLQDYYFPSQESNVRQMLANWAVGNKEVQLWVGVNKNFGRSDLKIYDRSALGKVEKEDAALAKEAIAREEKLQDSLNRKDTSLIK